MNQGSVAFQGTYEDLRKAQDLLYLVQETSAPSQAPGEKSEVTAIKDNDGQEQRQDNAEDETLKSYNNKGWHPYVLWAQMAGVHRVVLSLCLAATWGSVSLGMNVRYSSFFYSWNSG